jgi:hypothetical protein
MSMNLKLNVDFSVLKIIITSFVIKYIISTLEFSQVTIGSEAPKNWYCDLLSYQQHIWMIISVTSLKWKHPTTMHITYLTYDSHVHHSVSTSLASPCLCIKKWNKINYHIACFEVTVLWCVMPCSLVDTTCIYGNLLAPKCWHLSTKIHNITSKNYCIF